MRTTRKVNNAEKECQQRKTSHYWSQLKKVREKVIEIKK